MARKVTYNIIPLVDGSFDLEVFMDSKLPTACKRLLTLADVEKELECIMALMAACGAEVVRLEPLESSQVH